MGSRLWNPVDFVEHLIDSMVSSIIDSIEAFIEDPQKIIEIWVGLLLPSSWMIFMVATGFLLMSFGHEVAGNILIFVGNWVSNTTTKIALAVSNLIPYLFVIFSVVSIMLSFFRRFS
jgi:hypothetical protein